ncbi:MAG: TonB-dependent receptor [Pseudomonadota bacterium]
MTVRSTARLTTAVLALSAVTLPANAWADGHTSIHLPAQPLEEAIAELGDQTGLQIVARSQDLRGVESGTVSGSMSPMQALSRLLSGTGLEVRRVAEDSVVVQQAASDDEDDDFILPPIIVTGERVEREVFDTASSVRVYGSGELERNVQKNDFERTISDAANVLTVGVSNQTPFIRGQSSAGPVTGAGAALSGQLPRASLTVDGRVQSFNELAYSPTSVWDVEAVEVFRGPQTTSQGANAIAGAFNIRTKDPVFAQEYQIRGEVGTDNKRVASLVANAPISNDIAVRFAADYQTQEGFITFPAGIPSGSEAESIDQFTARGKLLWEPSALPQLSTKLTLSYTDYSRPQTQNVVEPFEDLVSNATGGFASAFYGYNFAAIHDISYDFDSGIRVQNRIQYSEGDSTRTTDNPAEQDFAVEGNEWGNEFLVTFDPEGGPFSGIFGIFYRESQSEVPDEEGIVFTDEKTDLGIFTEGTYRFDNGLDVTAGVRFQRNTQERVVESGPPTPLMLDFDGEFEAWLPKFSVGYEPNEDLRFAFQVSRGFNPGGVGGSFLGILGILPIPDPFFEFDEEKVTNYELSMRGNFLDGRMVLAANAFYMDFEDYQFIVPTFITGTPFIDSFVVNAEGVETYGLELDANVLVTPDLRINAAVGLLESEITKFDSAAIDVEGNTLPFSPPFNASLGFDYNITDDLLVGGQARYSGVYYSDLQNSDGNKIDGVTTIDLRASYQVTGTTQIYGYVNNLLDDIEPLSISGTAPNRLATTTRPREIGVGFQSTF